MKALIWLPSIVLNTLTLLLPRRLFIATYKPSSPELRDAENKLRNVARRADYEAKKVLYGVKK